MKPNITIEQAEALLEKYYEGETSLQEEALLKDFLAQKDLPATFDAEKALFGFFAAEKQPEATLSVAEPEATNVVEFNQEVPSGPRHLLFANPIFRWSMVAAVAVGVVFLLNIPTSNAKTNYTYVNGVKYTDATTIRKQALASISQFADEPDEVAESAANINDQSVVEEQLAVFADGLE